MRCEGGLCHGNWHKLWDLFFCELGREYLGFNRWPYFSPTIFCKEADTCI